MNELNEIRVTYHPDRKFERTRPLFQFDYGQMLYLDDFPLANVFEVHFSHYRAGHSTAVLGENNQVEIPDMFLISGKPIYCWVYAHVGDTDGQTICEIHIPVIERPEIGSDPPTPVQKDLIDDAIAKLDNAVQYATEVKGEIQALIDIYDPTSSGLLVDIDGGDANQADWEHGEVSGGANHS